MTLVVKSDMWGAMGQGGLIDIKARCAVQYVINLLVLDSISIFKAVDLAMDRIRGDATLSCATLEGHSTGFAIRWQQSVYVSPRIITSPLHKQGTCPD